jgi:SRSO17 transposase
VVADADYGDNPTFLAGLEERHERYVVAVRCDVQVRSKSRGAPSSQRADQVLAALPKCQWRTIRWRHGTKGWLRKKFVALRVWRLTAEGEAHIGWLLGERAARGQPEERKFYWSNLPASASLETLVNYAHRRHAIEQFHEEAKEELGWDQYQGRLWPGFHRHAVTVMLALSFLTCLELQHRHSRPNRGRPRDPFSPSARLAASCSASGAPGGSAVAAPPSCVVVDHHRAIYETVLT